MNEAAFIASLRVLASDPAARGLDDDAAVLVVGGPGDIGALVLTQDTLVSGIHVRDDEDPADIAWKLVAVNLSDLAAKGAEPVGVLISHMLGEGDERFVAGLGDVLRAYAVPLLGGDTVGSGGTRRSWTCTAIGRAAHSPVPDRRGAKPGDALWITGPLGAALAGFEALRDGTGADSAAYRRPRPLLAEGRALAPQVSAMMDVSDGLLLDARRMAEASGTTIDIDTAAVPVALPEDRRGEALRWGDDYQLLVALPRGAEPPVSASLIGEVRERAASPLLVDGQPPAAGDRLGYEHGRFTGGQ